MATLTPLPVSGRRTLQSIGAFGAHAPAALAGLPPHALVRALRGALRMTQAQLARRAGLPQSHLARIELGKVDPQLSTLRKLFQALFCEVLVVPRLQKGLEDAIVERAREKARRNVARVSGTMALEKQRPDDETIRALIRSEEARLLSKPSSELWDD